MAMHHNAELDKNWRCSQSIAEGSIGSEGMHLKFFVAAPAAVIVDSADGLHDGRFAHIRFSDLNRCVSPDVAIIRHFNFCQKITQLIGKHPDSSLRGVFVDSHLMPVEDNGDASVFDG